MKGANRKSKAWSVSGMKFGKLLKSWAAEEKPENAELVLRFKDLKKQLKLVKPAEQGSSKSNGSEHYKIFRRQRRLLKSKQA